MVLRAQTQAREGAGVSPMSEWVSGGGHWTLERAATMILFLIEFIHPNEMKLFVISEWRRRGCNPISNNRKEWKINHCTTYCHKKDKVLTGATCICDKDLCNGHATPYAQPDCSKAGVEQHRHMSMDMEAPYDGAE